MHPNSEREASVKRFQRPPIRQSVLVQSDISHTLGMFVRTIALWWPVALFSSGKEEVRDILVEERLLLPSGWKSSSRSHQQKVLTR